MHSRWSLRPYTRGSERNLAMSASSFDLGGNVHLSENSQVDPGVVLGYMTGRRISDVSLHIGPGARVRAGTVIAPSSSTFFVDNGVR